MNGMTMHELLGASTAVSAALQSGVLSAILDGAANADVVAGKAKTDPRTTRLVLDVLAAIGVVDREGETYSASAALVDAVAMAPLGIAGVARIFGHTSEMLDTGKPLVVMQDSREREATYRNVVDALAKLSAGHAEILARSLERAPARVLDIGCGSGVWSLAIAQRFSDTRVTGLDLPDVVRRFEARAQALGLAERARAIGADIHDEHAAGAVAPASFDLVVVANVLRIEDEARAKAIVARAAEASSREVVIVDALAEGTPARERARAVYTLHLALRSRDGNVYSREVIASWLAKHGMRLRAVVDFEESSPAAALVFERG